MLRQHFLPQTKQVLLLTICLTGVTTSVQAIELKEGNWGINTETTNPMASAPIVEYVENCIGSDFDPMAELFDSGIENCEVLSQEDSAKILELSMQCSLPGAGNVKGDILFLSDGESASGQMDMQMSMGGMSMNISSSWQGEYLGACTE